MKNSKRLIVTLIGLVFIVLILIAVIIVSILSLPESISSASPTATPTARPTIKPTIKTATLPSPTPTPEPTSEAEYAQEIAKLGIIDENRVIKKKYVDMVVFKNNEDELKISFVEVIQHNSIQVDRYYEFFSGECLFESDTNLWLQIFNEGSTDGVIPVNKALSDVTFLRLSTPMGQIFDFSSLGIELPLSMELYDLFNENREDGEFSKSEYADIYLKYIPKEYRVYGSELIPGDINDRLSMMNLPGITVSPTPESEPTPTAIITPTA